ncbi:SNF2-related domain-containing protein [Tieghemostelium lacteum]|uniref:SNF2-related domain-containing protein n=1 Tax=Tieghemostelium lacteum TaxID=361077 RepID=A0A152A5A0_TIELA|nr:SNF2-related domain-containing protein [Tieghemostelium lacteum]|eukprot:KYR01271.1 SNF2-related domain-containing protein [Tieghemostelium lacteum]
MKRSLTPSFKYEQKKVKLDLPELGVVAESIPAPKGPGRKKKVAEPVINHLQLYQINKKVEDALLSEEEKSENNSENGTTEGGGKEETKKGKNVFMNSTSPFMYFLIKYKNTQKVGEEGTAILEVSYENAIIFNLEGKQIGKTGLTRMGENDPEEGQKVLIKKKEVYFNEDFSMNIGNKWVKLIIQVNEEEYKNGSIFLKTDEIIAKKKKEKQEKKATYILAAARRPKGFIVPYKGLEKQKKLTKPLHSPYAKDAIVLYQPIDTSNEKIACVIDPLLAKKLRPHQKEGVQFMFDCLMGLKGGFKGNGCILADDMGLGKTIQAITILWTLLKQSPSGEPAARKAVIVAPTSLVGNWCKELKKWLGDGIIPVAIGSSTKLGRAKLSELQFGKADVLVISYDQLRIYCDEICKIPTIGLVVCDEGHRLKNAEIKTTKAVASIPTTRRVILSGTPIQNDLTEFYAMVDFVNPGVLKNVTTFKHVYDTPIVSSRNPEASDEEKRLGKERSLELTRLTSQFILRRTAVINTQYLPPKIEYIVVCKLTPLQTSIYKHLIHSVKEGSFASTSGALPLITTLKKLSNCVELVYLPDKENPTELNQSTLSLFPKEWNPKIFQPQYSSKLLFVDRLLSEIRATSKDRVVIVSNYTQTLEVLAVMCRTRKYEFLQLDGSLKQESRQKNVDIFNDPTRPEFVFLLSSRAGGVGLNLIGGNHLILFDSDWNPANDAQAMARVWREGQKKVVSIYRLLTTGTIEEKIYQRQLTKVALSTSVVEGDSNNSPAFETRDLKDIFTLKEDTICDTHDMLSCKCAPSNRVPKHKRDAISINELSKWKHFHEMEKLESLDKKLAKACKDIATFVFANDKGPQAREVTPPAKTTTTTTTTTNKSKSDSDDEILSQEKPVFVSTDDMTKKFKNGLDADDDEETPFKAEDVDYENDDGYSDEEHSEDSDYSSDD